MIERHITFAVNAGSGEAFERYYTDTYRPQLSASPGFVDSWLLRSLEDEHEYQLVFRFETAEDAVTWRTSEVHEALQPALHALHHGLTIQPYTIRA